MNITDSFRHTSPRSVVFPTSPPPLSIIVEPNRVIRSGRGRVVTASASSSSLPLLHARSLLFPSLLPPSIEMERGPPLARSNDLPGPTCGSRSCCCYCICRDDTQRWFHPKMHDNLKVTVVPFSNHTGPGNNVCKTWSSRTQAGLGRTVSQEEEQISPNRHYPVPSTHY